MKYLLQATTSDKTIKLIETIGSLWKLVLILAVIILILRFYKGIGSWFNRLIKFKLVGQEVHLKETQNEQQLSHVTEKIENTLNKEESLVDESKETHIKTKESVSLLEIAGKYKENEQEAERLFSQLQNDIDDKDEKRENEFKYLYIKYLNGDIDGINKIKKIIEEEGYKESTKAVGLYFLGACYELGKNYIEAIKFFAQGIEKNSNENKNIDAYTSIGNCYYESEGEKKAISYFLEILPKVTNDVNKSKILKAASKIYEKEGDKFKKCLMLIKAQSYTPNDTTILFDSAYAFHDLEMYKLALYIYKEHEYYSNDGSVENNIAVTLSALKLNGLSKNYYFKSLKNGVTLAVGNIAQEYIKAGFFDDAERVLNEIKDRNDLEERVWSAFKRLKESREDEGKKFQEYLEQGGKMQLFLNKVADLYLDIEENKLTGISYNSYLYRNEEIQIKESDSNFEMIWSYSQNDYKMEIPKNKRAGYGRFYEKPSTESYYDSKKAIFYIDDLGNIEIGKMESDVNSEIMFFKGHKKVSSEN